MDFFFWVYKQFFTTCERSGWFIHHNFVCAFMSYPHLPDRVHADGCVPAGYQQVRGAPRPAPQSHTETTGSQTGSSLGSCRTAQNCREHMTWYRRILQKVFNNLIFSSAYHLICYFLCGMIKLNWCLQCWRWFCYREQCTPRSQTADEVNKLQITLSQTKF